MELGLYPGKIKDMVGKTVSTNMKLLEAQARFAEGLIKRNSAVIVEITDARISSLQELTSAKSFTELYDNTLAFEGAVRDKVLGLYEDNSAASKEFRQEVKSLLEIDEMVAKVKCAADEVGDKVKSLTETTIAKAKDLSEDTLAKTKDFSDNGIAKAKDLSDAAIAKVKEVAGNFTVTARKTFTPVQPAVEKAAPKAAKKSATAPRKAPVTKKAAISPKAAPAEAAPAPAPASE